jgi:hypothetical protein
MAHRLIYLALATKTCNEVREISDVLNRASKYQYEALREFAEFFIHRECPNFWRGLERLKDDQFGVLFYLLQSKEELEQAIHTNAVANAMQPLAEISLAGLAQMVTGNPGYSEVRSKCSGS